MTKPSWQEVQAKYNFFRGQGLRVLAKAAGAYSKRPLGDGWQEQPSISLDKLKAVYDRGLADGLCLAMGADDNEDWYYFAVDCDVKSKNQVANASEIHKLGGKTLVIESASKGFHLIYKVKADDPRIKEYDVATRKNIIPDVDVRAHGGHIVTAPSMMTYTGEDAEKRYLDDGFVGQYEIFREYPIAEAPTKLLEVIGRGKEIAHQKRLANERRNGHHGGHNPVGRDISISEIIEMIDVVLPTLERLPFEPWLAMVHAAHSGSDGADEVFQHIYNHEAANHTWVRYQNLPKTWQGFNPNGGITVASLIKMAKERGWKRKGGRPKIDKFAPKPGSITYEREKVTDNSYQGFDESIAALGKELRYNTRKQRPEFRDLGSTEDDWTPFDDLNAAKLRSEIQRGFWYAVTTSKGDIPKAFEMGADRFMEYLQAQISSRREDPFLMYLEALRPWDPDTDTPRLANILVELFKAEDTEYTQWAGKAIFIGAIQRSYDWGCKLDEMIILKGEQGIGKSEFFKDLLPHWHWVSDSVRFDMDQKVQAEQAEGAVFVEIQEMAGLKGRYAAHPNDAKIFVTRRSDKCRKAYGRYVSELERMYRLLGTTNDDDPLPDDPTGNRRYQVIECGLERGEFVDRDYTRTIRDNLWREALYLYQQGERANLPEHLWKISSTIAEKHRQRSNTEIVLLDIAFVKADYTVEEIRDKANGELDKAGQKTIIEALKVLGWTKCRPYRDGKQVKAWQNPSPNTLPDEASDEGSGIKGGDGEDIPF